MLSKVHNTYPQIKNSYIFIDEFALRQFSLTLITERCKYLCYSAYRHHEIPDAAYSKPGSQYGPIL